MTTKSVKKAQANPPYGPVRVTIPAKIAYDLGTLEKGIESLVDKLGCRTCFSGADCTFVHEREFVLGEINAGPRPEPWYESRFEAHQVTILLSKDVSYDLDAVKGALKKIVGLGGCPCHSGLDISFIHELGLVSRLSAQNINERLDAQGGFAVINGSI